MITGLGSVLWPVPKTLPPRLNHFSHAYEKIRPYFQGFLERYSREAFIINDSSRIVLTTLEAALPELQRRLGDRLLGFALGGSIVRGLGTPQTSDVDFYLYVRSATEKEVDECLNFVQANLRIAGLNLCPARGDYLLDDSAPLEIIGIAVSIHTNYFIYKHPELDKIVQNLLDKVRRGDCDWVGPQPMAENAKCIYLDLSGTQVEYVVEKFLLNIVFSLLSETGAHTLARDRNFARFLERAAAPYIARRKRAVIPFPAELADLFKRRG